MNKKHIQLSYGVPHLNKRSSASVVIYSKSGKHSVFLRESEDNEGMSLTNSIEFAVIELSKYLGCHPEVLQVFQLDYHTEEYDLVKFKEGNPTWVPTPNSKLLSLITSWIGLSEEDEKHFK